MIGIIVIKSFLTAGSPHTSTPPRIGVHHSRTDRQKGERATPPQPPTTGQWRPPQVRTLHSQPDDLWEEGPPYRWMMMRGIGSCWEILYWYICMGEMAVELPSSLPGPPPVCIGRSAGLGVWSLSVWCGVTMGWPMFPPISTAWSVDFVDAGGNDIDPVICSVYTNIILASSKIALYWPTWTMFHILLWAHLWTVNTLY